MKRFLTLPSLLTALAFVGCGIVEPEQNPYIRPIPDPLKNDVVVLLLPVPDTNSSGVWSGKTGTPKLESQGVSSEFGNNRAYQIYTQKVGYWNDSLEWEYNRFLLETHYYFVDELDGINLSQAHTDSLFDQLNDVYTTYSDSTEAEALLQAITTSTSSGVIGIRIRVVPTGDTVTVLQVAPNSPASGAGIQKGDAILEINDSNVVGDSAIYRFNSLSEGDSGTALSFTLWRGGQTLPVSLVKGVVDFPSLLVDTIGNVATIQVFSFTQTTYNGLSTLTEFQAALEETQGFSVTLLDVRGNPGGSVNEVVEMCDEIVQEGILIREESRFLDLSYLPVVEASDFSARRQGLGEGRSFILLGDGFSASASEIFASCLTEGESVPFVGQTTFGKGIGQVLFNTPGKGLTKVTITQFKSRSNAVYHRMGIVPSHPTPDSLILETALDLAGTMSPLAKSAVNSLTGGALQRKMMEYEWNRKQYLRESVPVEVIQNPVLLLHPFQH